jgi:hypothetical protein
MVRPPRPRLLLHARQYSVSVWVSSPPTDGRYSEAERGKLGKLARALEADDATLALLKDQVTEHLLAQIAGIENPKALCEVARELLA